MALTIAGKSEQRDIILPDKIIEKLLDSDNSNAVRLYLCLCLKGCDTKKEELCATLRLTEYELKEAEIELLRLGLANESCPDVKNCTVTPQSIADVKIRYEAPVYTKEEIISLKQGDKAFEQIVREASAVIKPLLTESDLRELMTIYSYFGMPGDCLIMLLHFTASRAAEQSDGTRRPSLLTVKKEAFRWLDRGITTAQKADAFIKEENRIYKITQSMEKAAGLDVYTNDDKRLIRTWAELGFDSEAVAIAADISKSRLGEIKLLYMGRILKNWKSENLTNSKDILKAEKLRQREQELSMTAHARKQTGKKQVSGSDGKLSRGELEALKEIEDFDTYNRNGGA